MQLARLSRRLHLRTETTAYQHLFNRNSHHRAAKTGEDVITNVSRTRNIGIIAHIDAVWLTYSFLNLL